MLDFVLFLHSLLRWLVLLAGLWALFRAARGWLGSRAFEAADAAAGRIYTISLDVQFLVGLFTAAVSPAIRTLLQNPAAINASETVRFFALEHIPVMILALAAAHGTAVLARRAEADADRHRRLALGFGLSLLLILVATPWWRPLLPGL